MSEDPTREFLESDPAILRELIKVAKRLAESPKTSKAKASEYRSRVAKLQKALDKFNKPKVGDVVWYEVGTDLQQAKIVAVDGTTEANIEILTGPQKGKRINAPWGIIRPLEK